MREWVDEVILHMTRANYVSLRLGSSLRMKAADALVTCGEAVAHRFAFLLIAMNLTLRPPVAATRREIHCARRHWG